MALSSASGPFEMVTNQGFPKLDHSGSNAGTK